MCYSAKTIVGVQSMRNEDSDSGTSTRSEGDGENRSEIDDSRGRRDRVGESETTAIVQAE